MATTSDRRSKVATASVAASSAGDGRALSTGFAEMSLGEKVAWVSLHALVLLVPLAISNFTFIGIGGGLPLTYDQFDVAKVFVLQVCAIVGLTGWCLHLLVDGGRVRRTRIDWVVIALLAWVGVTTATSVHWPTSLIGKYGRPEGLTAFLGYAAVFFLTVQLVDRTSRMRSLVRTLLVSGFLVMVYGALQYAGFEPIHYGPLGFEAHRSFATYGNPDILGGFTVFILPLAVVSALSESRVAWRIGYWIVAVVSAVTWITAFTRSAWIGGVVALGVVAVAAFRERIRLQREDWIMAGAAAALAGVIAVLSLGASSQVMNIATRLGSIFAFGEGSSQTRFLIWQAAWDAIKQRPVLGWGADTFRLLFPRFQSATYVSIAGYQEVADNAHSYPVQLATTLGIPGLLLVYGSIVSALSLSSRRAFSRDSSGSRLVYAGVWAAALGYVVHLSFAISDPGVTVFLWLCLGLLLAPAARTVDVTRPAAVWRATGATILAVVALGLLAGNVAYVAADHAYLKGKEDRATPDVRVAQIQRAVRLNPLNYFYRGDVGMAYREYGLLRLNGQIGDPSTGRQDALVLFKQAEQSFRDTIRFVPAEYDNYVFLSGLYNIMAAYYDPAYYQQSIEVARQGLAVGPTGPALRVQYAEALFNTRKPAEAATQLEYALKLDPTYAEAVLLLSDVRESQGQLEQAVQELKAVDALKPGQPGVAERITSLEASLTAR